MEFAYICDAVRTPFGRYGGSLAAVRPDDLAAIPLRALLARNPATGPGRIDDVILGCVNQAGEDNRNVARMALLLAGHPARGSRDDGEPAVRIEPGSGRDGGARHPLRRNRAGDRRRGGKHVALTAGALQVRRAVDALAEARRHNARVAFRQPADAGAIRRRFDGGDGRERRRRMRHLACRPGRLRIAKPAACGGGEALPADWRKKSYPSQIPKKVAVSTDEHPRPDTTLEALAALSPSSGRAVR